MSELSDKVQGLTDELHQLGEMEDPTGRGLPAGLLKLNQRYDLMLLAATQEKDSIALKALKTYISNRTTLIDRTKAPVIFGDTDYD